MATGKKPRIRKVETVRERNEKLTRKSEETAGKVRRQPLKKVGRSVAKPLKAAAKPLNKRPVRFAGRIFSKVLLINYFRNSYKELKQVTWPSRRETWKLTLAVLLFATVFGFFVAVTDFGLDKVIKRIVLR